VTSWYFYEFYFSVCNQQVVMVAEKKETTYHSTIDGLIRVRYTFGHGRWFGLLRHRFSWLLNFDEIMYSRQNLQSINLVSMIVTLLIRRNSRFFGVAALFLRNNQAKGITS
jgi:hypothetical protein